MKAFLVPMLAVALSAPAAADPLTLAAAVDRAMHHNSELQALGHHAAALEGRVAQAGAYPNPSLDYLREGSRQQDGSTSLQLALPIETGGKRAARVDAASAERRVADADLAVARLRVQAEAIAAFHEAWLAQQRVELALLTEKAASKSTGVAAARVAAGKVSPVEETRATVAQANVALETIQATRDLSQARAKLALLLGADAGELAPPEAPSLPAAPGAHETSQGPAVQRAIADLDLRSATARLERSKRYQDVSLIVGQKREGIARERQTVLGLSVPLPLFDRNQGAILEAERRIDQSRAELAWARQRVQAEAAQAAARLTAALEQERVIRQDILPGSQSAYTAASRGFEAGKFNFLDVLDAQRTLFHAQAQHLRTISEAHRAAADLATLIGPTIGPTIAPNKNGQNAK